MYSRKLGQKKLMYMVQNFKSNTLVFVDSSFSYKRDMSRVYLSTLF